MGLRATENDSEITPIYTSSEVTQKTRLSRKQIGSFVEQGLIVAKEGTGRGIRRFSELNLTRLFAASRLLRIGKNTGEIVEISNDLPAFFTQGEELCKAIGQINSEDQEPELRFLSYIAAISQLQVLTPLELELLSLISTEVGDESNWQEGISSTENFPTAFQVFGERHGLNQTQIRRTLDEMHRKISETILTLALLKLRS
jgi:DNA-binding transcriptional MerR regulator